MNAAAALLTASVGTYALRHVSVRALADRRLPPIVGTILRHGALAVMAALVMSSLPPEAGHGAPSASTVGGLAAARRRSKP